ncbi:MAG: DUF3035 domain-containing protein [Rhodobacteraceae bacterium]|nr:DUF3035 domain-containing protein [Paracoccaceae bacterium]
MVIAARGMGFAIVAVLALSACERGDPILMNVRSPTRAPDEFAILPTKPLQMPEDITALPEPTPGGTNLTDPTPEADAVAALGGNPDRLVLTGRPTRDGALVSYATRFGVTPRIREILAAEDLAFRSRNRGRPLERLFNVNVYFKAYRRMALDQYAELERWRRAGVRTVGAPPDPSLD